MTAGPLTRAAVLALAALAVGACGKRGSPVAPQVRLPEAVSDLRATARADGIELTWTVPRRRVDGTRLFDPALARLHRVEDSGAGEPRPALRVDDRVAGYTEIAALPIRDLPPAERGRILYMDRRDLTFGRRYTYVALTTDEQGRTSPPSPRVSITYIAPPEAPAGLQVEAGDRESRLAWQAPTRLADGSPVSGTLTYEVLRAPDAVTEPVVVARTEATAVVDRGLVNDRTYQYAVRAVRSEGGATTSSAATPRVAVTPVKTTPPAPPTALAAIPSQREVRLSWTPSPAPDVAVYVVYRAAGGGAFMRVGSVRPPATTFVDRDVPPGRYRYAVTAQDTSSRANESARSNEAAVTVP